MKRPLDPDVRIRAVGPHDAPGIGRLVSALSETFIAPALTAQGREELRRSMAPDAIAGYLERGFRYHVAETGDGIVGVVATRDDSHLYHLFVAEDHQGRGIARALWEHALADCLSRAKPEAFTVNASLNAQGVYARFGFVAQSGPVTKDGVTFVPMKLELAS